jgi:DNA mismatch repair protein MutS2
MPKPIRKKTSHYSPTQHDCEMAIFAAELGSAPSIDLHGLGEHEAVIELVSHLNRHFCHQGGVVKVVHGRGTGVLRKAIHRMLKNDPLVAYFRDAHSPREHGGVTYVCLKRK